MAEGVQLKATCLDVQPVQPLPRRRRLVASCAVVRCLLGCSDKPGARPLCPCLPEWHALQISKDSAIHIARARYSHICIRTRTRTRCPTASCPVLCMCLPCLSAGGHACGAADRHAHAARLWHCGQGHQGGWAVGVDLSLLLSCAPCLAGGTLHSCCPAAVFCEGGVAGL